MEMRLNQRMAFTDQELENLKNGKCWCGKDKSEFQKGMKVFCSPEHREIWYKKVMTWKEFRDYYLNKHGLYCDICGRSADQYKKDYEQYKKQVQEIFKEHFEEYIAWRLMKLEENYEREYKEIINMKPEDVSEYQISAFAKDRLELPDPPKYEEITFEVDHKVAIVNGGAEFDENNLQVLCSECHRKKTKEDLKIAINSVKDIAKFRKDNLDFFEDEEVKE